VPLGEGGFLERARKRGAPFLKSPYFTAIGSSSMNTVADRYRHASYRNKYW